MGKVDKQFFSFRHSFRKVSSIAQTPGVSLVFHAFHLLLMLKWGVSSGPNSTRLSIVCRPFRYPSLATARQKKLKLPLKGGHENGNDNTYKKERGGMFALMLGGKKKTPVILIFDFLFLLRVRFIMRDIDERLRLRRKRSGARALSLFLSHNISFLE